MDQDVLMPRNWLDHRHRRICESVLVPLEFDILACGLDRDQPVLHGDQAFFLLNRPIRPAQMNAVFGELKIGWKLDIKAIKVENFFIPMIR